MSDIDLVRLLTADPLQYERVTFVGDGQTAQFGLPNSPIYPDSETVTLDGIPKDKPADYAIDDGVALLIFSAPPGVGVDGAATYKFSLLSDAQIQALLDYEGDVKLAAADALDSIASSEAMIEKRIKLLDLQTDGPSVAKSLREHAAVLRKSLFDPTLDEPTFDIIEQINDSAGFREKVTKDWMREQG